MAKGMKNWSEIKKRQSSREQKGCVVTVDKERVEEILKEYEYKLSNQKKFNNY